MNDETKFDPSNYWNGKGTEKQEIESLVINLDEGLDVISRHIKALRAMIGPKEDELPSVEEVQAIYADKPMDLTPHIVMKEMTNCHFKKIAVELAYQYALGFRESREKSAQSCLDNKARNQERARKMAEDLIVDPQIFESAKRVSHEAEQNLKHKFPTV